MCWIYSSLFLHNQHREGPWIPFFWRFYVVKIYLCTNNQQKKLILGRLLGCQFFSQQHDFGGEPREKRKSQTVYTELSHPCSLGTSWLQWEHLARALQSLWVTWTRLGGYEIKFSATPHSSTILRRNTGEGEFPICNKYILEWHRVSILF